MFLSELRRRNVFKVGAAYALVGWLLVQIADVFFPALQLPKWTVSLVAALVILGFPIALLLSWAYELTPDGVKQVSSIHLPKSITQSSGRKLDFVIIGVLLLATGFMFVDNYLSEPTLSASADSESSSMARDDNEAAEQTGLGFADRLPNSVAVLICDNLSPDPADAWLAEGIHIEILNQLRKIGSLKVISRNAVLQYSDTRPPIPQIAEELNVESVMDCSVRFGGDGILVTVELVNPATNRAVWEATYPGAMDDLNTIFSMQADIAMNIANALAVEFSSTVRERIEHPSTSSSEAYPLYLQALSHWVGGRDDWRPTLDAALALDPTFALAYATRAYWSAFDLTGQDGTNPTEALALAEAVEGDARRALSLNQDLGLAEAALAVLHQVYWRATEAEESFQRALMISPDDPDVLVLYGRFKRYRIELEDSIQSFQQALSLAPNDRFIHAQLAIAYRWASEWDASATHYQRALEGNTSSLPSRVGLAYVDAGRGNTEAALLHLRIAEELEPAPFRLSQIAEIYDLLGLPNEARRVFQRFRAQASEQRVGDAIWARAYFAVDENQLAMERLRRAIENRVPTDQATLAGFANNPYNSEELSTAEINELISRLWDEN